MSIKNHHLSKPINISDQNRLYIVCILLLIISETLERLAKKKIEISAFNIKFMNESYSLYIYCIRKFSLNKFANVIKIC